MIFEVSTTSGSLGIKSFGTYVTIEYYRGKDVAVTVPDTVEAAGAYLPVREIAKKAFVGAKSVNRIDVPESVIKVGEWGFASCSELRDITFGSSDVELGNGVFRDCKKLTKIIVNRRNEACSMIEGTPSDSAINVCADNAGDISHLLALAVSKMDASYLLDLKTAGSAEWIEHFDSTIEKFLRKDDSEGFSAMLLCGEEDYVGDDSNFDTFCMMKIKEKVRVIFVRLLHDLGLNDDYRKQFSDYLKNHMKDATWEVVLTEHGDDKEYFDILIECGCINDENISDLIASMGDRNSGMKGYLLKYKGENMSTENFFDELEL